MTIFTIERQHDFSYGHRIYGHESKCSHLHGHNGRVTFTCTANELDKVGRVLDFAEIKVKLCEWLETVWDHKFLIFADDPLKTVLVQNDPTGVVSVPFNPTAENMAIYLLNEVGPQQLKGTGVRLIKVVVEETRKCSASAISEDYLGMI